MTDVFNSDPAAPSPVTELVGEDKKFKTVDDLAKGKQEADAFIERLKSEMAELRGQLEGQTKLDELKEELKLLKEQSTQSKSQTGNALSEADIKALVTKAITDTERNQTSSQNVSEAQAVIIQKLGTAEAASKFITDKAKELGVSTEELKGIASRSPTAFLKMLDVQTETTQRSETFVKSTVNLQPNPGTTAKEGTWEYFNAIKAKSPKEYWTPRVQNAIHKATQAGTCILPD